MSRLKYILFLFLPLLGEAQEVQLLWNDLIRQGESAEVKSYLELNDGSFITLSSVIQPNSNGINSQDILIRKYNIHSEIIWERLLSSNGYDMPIKIIEDLNGDLLLLVTSNSNDGLFNVGLGREDIYLLRLSTDGSLIHKNVYGGSKEDFASDIIALPNNRHLIIGTSSSEEFSPTTFHGSTEILLTCIDQNGAVIWNKFIGGSESDFAVQAYFDEDDEYLYILGSSSSYDGDLEVNYGDNDVVLFKTNLDGELSFGKNYGGSYNESAATISKMEKGNLIVGATTFSSNYDISNNNGSADIWVFEIDDQGSLIQEKTFGGEKNELVTGITLENEVVRILGSTTSSNSFGDFSTDIVYIEYNWNSEEMNYSRFGGDKFEIPNFFCFDYQGSMIIAGSTNSEEGIINSSNDGFDGFIAKFSISANTSSSLDAIKYYPNPFTDRIFIDQLTDGMEIHLYTLGGQEMEVVTRQQFNTTTIEITNDLGAGIYLLNIKNDSQSKTIRLIKE